MSWYRSLSWVVIMKFYREHDAIPAEYISEEYVFRPLTTKDVKLDYDAVMESKTSLRRIWNSTWPSDDFSIEENYDDLERHEMDHLARKEFTFTIMNSDETECLGCMYFRPLLESFSTGDYQTAVRFWVRSSRIQDNLDKRVLEGIIHWLQSEWKFNKIVFVTGINEERQPTLFKNANMQPIHSDSSETTRFQYYVLSNKK